ncbi:hypothetical protein CYMTET_29854 [Cymbomonas tetramitiformis]|uniref:Uncharacterized protein n=1 Tax=Cymbomonas tetramitiformis TaxID=36881 RepID=A0AAE0FJY9_9CHLO|nr:hypothetical protein CYMTET_29854 [Cymbomonas tetramitiformis]
MLGATLRDAVHHSPLRARQRHPSVREELGRSSTKRQGASALSNFTGSATRNNHEAVHPNTEPLEQRVASLSTEDIAGKHSKASSLNNTPPTPSDGVVTTDTGRRSACGFPPCRILPTHRVDHKARGREHASRAYYHPATTSVSRHKKQFASSATDAFDGDIQKQQGIMKNVSLPQSGGPARAASAPLKSAALKSYVYAARSHPGSPHNQFRSRLPHSHGHATVDRFLRDAPLVYQDKADRLLRSAGAAELLDAAATARAQQCGAWETANITGLPPVRLVFGLGTGRSGTVSLAQLLSKQKEGKQRGLPRASSVTHEREPLLSWSASSVEERLVTAAKRMDAIVHHTWERWLKVVARAAAGAEALVDRKRRQRQQTLASRGGGSSRSAAAAEVAEAAVAVAVVAAAVVAAAMAATAVAAEAVVAAAA